MNEVRLQAEINQRASTAAAAFVDKHKFGKGTYEIQKMAGSYAQGYSDALRKVLDGEWESGLAKVGQASRDKVLGGGSGDVRQEPDPLREGTPG